ncbi:ATP-binding protein [Enterococcus faecium]|uniref:ATP-binding protein n=1 Tax=Enterococcus faecium TaxID=1352 RepID=UPI00338F49ED|nr:ATP-binding protein [Enterococcus faecium]
MESLANAMEKLIRRVLVQSGKCPECSEPLYSWRAKNKDGSERCKPTCMSCGYKALRVKEDIQTERIYNDSLKARALSFFQNGSVLTDKTLFKCKMENYHVVDQETKIALERAKSFVNDVLLNHPAHFILSGKSGSGKSHLSMATAWEILERSNYDKKILFISYQELLEQIKFSYNNSELRKEIEGSLIADIKTTDLVVFDDIGAELGSGVSNSRQFTNNTLNTLLEARQNKATIITTNLSGPELREAYGERIVSRIFKNSEGYALKFQQTADKRIKPVKGSIA